MSEWKRGLDTAHNQGLIDVDLRDQLLAMPFDREVPSTGFPMRIALIVLGAILVLSAGFAVALRVLGDDPSQVLIALVLAVITAFIEGIAWLIRRARPLTFLAGIAGTFAGVTLGLSVAILIPNDLQAMSGAVGSLVAAAWSLVWYRRSRGGIPIAAVIGEVAAFVGFVSDWAGLNYEITGFLLCAMGVLAAVVCIFGRIKPSLPPLVVSLIVIGIGSTMQNSYGGDITAVIGLAISAALFLVAYRRGEALLTAATAVATGVWSVVLTITLTSGALAPLVVAALVGVALIVWGTRLSRR